MGRRSQRHKAAVHGYNPPPITAILPDTATLTAAGAVGRTVATLSATGGTPPFVFTLTSAAGLSASFTGNLLKTTVDPAGTVGLHTATVTVVDSWGKTLAEPLAVTLS